uniref:Uncharacterized protein n=1 Tax=Arundo donax TaxID=35708 RepID=A0A0A9GFP3_ARUDO
MQCCWYAYETESCGRFSGYRIWWLFFSHPSINLETGRKSANCGLQAFPEVEENQEQEINGRSLYPANLFLCVILVYI